MPKGITYSIVANATDVETALGELAALFPRYVNAWLIEAANMTKGEMKSKVNQGVGASMGQGIANNIDIEYNTATQSAVVAPNKSVASYALPLETGSAPHRPPSGPDSSLAQWCEMKGLNVFAVAATIARDGTKPHPFVAPTFRVVEGPIKALFSNGVAMFLDMRGAL
ncbi:hypothetical protein [Subtercola sp. RTI3]|uniref:hypothetical protein n=1 Tax=Subtercola sp. RTI3 TaxID=3048639 RepID=UPI002B234F2A|nr:hypothetical protein [Subtercola sp. RTI3]MEA9986252.1 hypothetical protein [Subtercola sp. RTI3]